MRTTFVVDVRFAGTNKINRMLVRVEERYNF